MRLFLLILLFMPLVTYAAAPSVDLTNLTIKPQPHETVLSFTLSQSTVGRVKYLPPNKIYIDFANTKARMYLNKVHLKNANVLSIQTVRVKPNTLRFILTVSGPTKWHIQLKKIKNMPTNVIVEITLQHNTPQKSTQTKSNSSQQKLQALFKQSALSIFKQLNAELAREPATITTVTTKMTSPQKPTPLFTVVIDAGHGGKDTGALGRDGTYEKTIVLAIAKRLANKINQTPNMRAMLTRSGDYFVPLRNRLKLARKGDADLFIAIHADAYFDKSATGASVYALSQRGATTEAARWLARQENYSELGDIEFSQLQDRSPILRSVLIDLAQTATIRDSLRLGNKLLYALDNMTSLHYKHVAQAPFVVLKSPDIPSVLIEIGFITNPREEQRLTSNLYQVRLSNAILAGIERYIKTTPGV